MANNRQPAHGFAASSPSVCSPEGLAASAELNAAAADPAIQARFADLGGPPVTGSPADFGRIIADDVAKWAKVIKAAGLTGD